MSELNVEGMALAPGVVETIVSIAVSEVEGVACVGSAGTQGRGIRAVFGQKPSTQGIEITVNEDNKLAVAVRIEVYYGFRASRGRIQLAPGCGRCGGKPGRRRGCLGRCLH